MAKRATKLTIVSPSLSSPSSQDLHDKFELECTTIAREYEKERKKIESLFTNFHVRFRVLFRRSLVQSSTPFTAQKANMASLPITKNQIAIFEDASCTAATQLKEIYER